jgi:putative component of toxin-antitoxin plasmid stabilization module
MASGDKKIIMHDAKAGGIIARAFERVMRSKPGDVSPVRGQRSGAPVKGQKKK